MKRADIRKREHDVTRAVLAGAQLRGLGIMYGISHERVRQVVARTLGRLAAQHHEAVPTIPQARENATRWRAFIAQEQHEGGSDGNT